jgi:undecaprenyl-diphosphatase
MAGRWRPHLAADRWMLLAFLGIAASLLLFLKLSSEVLEGDTAAFDSAILQAIRHATEGDTPVRNWLRGFMIALTALGDTSVLVLVVLVVTGYLLVIRQRAMALYLFSALALGRIGTALLKLVVARDRPGVVEHLVPIHSLSFPSGHASASAMAYLTMAALLARTQASRGPRVYIMSVTLLLTLAVGFSRLYLGVHWPTDVLAGWIVGAGWAAASTAIAIKLGIGRRRAGWP